MTHDTAMFSLAAWLQEEIHEVSFLHNSSGPSGASLAKDSKMSLLRRSWCDFLQLEGEKCASHVIYLEVPKPCQASPPRHLNLPAKQEIQSM